MYQRRLLARDEAPGAYRDLWTFLTEHLDQDALGEAETLLRQVLDKTGDGVAAMDEPPPFSGRPSPGGKLDPIASDSVSARRGRVAAAAAFAKKFPGASRIRVVG
jgi:hypothetical protein